MAAMQVKSFCVLEYAKCSSVTSVQRAFLRKYGKAAPGHQSILRWFRQFRETGCLYKGKSTGRPRVSEEIVEHVRQSFVRSPQKSTVRASRELGIPQKTVWNVLRRRLHFKPYRLQLLQHLTPDDYGRRFDFCTRMQLAMEDKVYVPPLPTTLQALQERITAAVADIDGNMILNVWTELDYRLDVCRVTKGAHIEHL